MQVSSAGHRELAAAQFAVIQGAQRERSSEREGVDLRRAAKRRPASGTHEDAAVRARRREPRGVHVSLQQVRRINRSRALGRHDGRRLEGTPDARLDVEAVRRHHRRILAIVRQPGRGVRLRAVEVRQHGFADDRLAIQLFGVESGPELHAGARRVTDVDAGVI